MNSEMTVTFPGGMRVNAAYKNFVIATDQPAPAGDGRAPAPFDLFLAALATCAGVYALSFCRERGLPTAGLKMTQQMEYDHEKHRVKKIRLLLTLPAGFPAKYQAAIIKAVELCAVKRHILEPPEFEVAAS